MHVCIGICMCLLMKRYVCVHWYMYVSIDDVCMDVCMCLLMRRYIQGLYTNQQA